jgi:type II secretory pathway pseudopilin PulG
MGIIFTFFIFIFGLFSGLVTSNYSGAQSKAEDTVRKNDINSIYQKLEEYYNENGDYPTADAVQKNYETIFPGINPEAFIDPNDIRINEGGDYTYTPTSCTALGCANYTLSTKLDSEEPYTKTSLN